MLIGTQYHGQHAVFRLHHFSRAASAPFQKELYGHALTQQSLHISQKYIRIKIIALEASTQEEGT